MEKKEKKLRPSELNTKILAVRVPIKDYNMVLARAAMYADGDLSAWLRFCVVKRPPIKMLKRKKE